MSSESFEHLAPLPVSVVIVNWNHRDLLLACLRSLTRDQGVGFEVILVDNGSTDGSVEAAEAFAASAPFPIRLIRNSSNAGFCEPNNQGIEAARGEFVALLNNDAEAEPLWLANLLAAFGRPEVGMAASKILVYDDPKVIDKVGHLIYPDGQNRGRGTGELDQGQYDRVEEVLWPDGCACMYRKSMLKIIGGFDIDLFAYADDAELGMRARIAGWACLYMPGAVVRHHRGSTMGKLNPRRITLIERNRVLLAAKLFPGSLLWRNPAYSLARLLSGLWAAVNNRGEIGHFPNFGDKLTAAWAFLLGDLQALLMLPRTLRKRRLLNPIRKLTPRQVHRMIMDNSIPLKDLSQMSAHPRT